MKALAIRHDLTKPCLHWRCTRANAGSLICVTPAAPGATLTTIINDTPVMSETIVADGSEQSLTDSECRGWQRAEWSQLGARLFARAEITCADQTTRTVSGLAMMTAGPNWTDIQVIESEGRKSLRVRRYQRAADQSHANVPSSTARAASTIPLVSRLTIAEVQEASGKVAPEALQAAIVELGNGFDLNGKRLIELDEAGVADSVIDLMIALSFPKRFVVERAGSSGGAWGGGSWGPDPLSMWPLFTHPYFYSSYYAPFGYRNWGLYDGYYFQGPGFVPVDGSQGEVEPSGEGRVVDGRGYTRVRRTEPAVVGRANGSDGSGSNSGSSAGSSESSGSGGNSGVSSSGYSGGGASGGRTAQPRPPGGL